MEYFIPSNLDLDNLLLRYPPLLINSFKKDKLIYIINLLTLIPATNKDLNLKNGFVPVCSKLIKKKIINYRQYFDYLISAGIILTNNHFIIGQQAKGYKFATEYSKKVKPISIDKSTLKTSLNNKSAALGVRYKHLSKWYNSYLQINSDLAYQFIEYDLEYKLNNPDKRDFNEKTNKLKDPYNQYNSALVNISKIAAGVFNLSVDRNVGRLHSVLTNLRSEIRHFITYNNQRLVSIDLKNSQPFFITLILKKSFWEKRQNLSNNNKLININKYFKQQNNKIFKNDYDFNSYVMWLNSSEISHSNDFERYRRLVTQGKLYEYLSGEMNFECTDRKKLKKVIFQLLFTDNRYLGQVKAGPKRVFKKLFPTVYTVIAKIKSRDKTNLPRLLQRIESHLILLVITKRIAKERPLLPIFTIHDSIITTVGNEEYVQSVMREEIKLAIGYEPTLHLEYWNEEKLKLEM